MPMRWRCCKCDNNWMLVEPSKDSVCTWEKCKHRKCNGCEEKFMNAPALGPYGGPLVDEDVCRHDHGEEEEEIFSIVIPTRGGVMTPNLKPELRCDRDGREEGERF
ncbi:hypothetical protein RUND412_002700 [Rhizina undulata]